MRRLSSIFKPRLRPWIALACVVIVAGLLVVSWLDVHRGGKVPWVLLGVAIPLLAGVCAHLRNAVATGMVDEAWVDGDELLLQRAGQSIRMSLTNVSDVEVALRGGLVTLSFCLPCALGARARFIAPPRRQSDIEAELRRRIDAARARHA